MPLKTVYFILFSVFFFMNSCRFFDPKNSYEKNLIEKELNSLNWNKVDELPSIGSCEDIKDVQSHQECFFSGITKLVEDKITENGTTILFPNMDTLRLEVTVFPDSNVIFVPIFSNDFTIDDRNEIDSIIAIRLADFPKIHPALKRGIPVKAQFFLSIELKIENAKTD